MRSFTAAILLGHFLALDAHAAVLKGRIYTNSSPEKVSYLWEKTDKKTGQKLISSSKYTDLTGKNTLVEEIAEYDAGALLKYNYKQLQVDEGGTIEIKNGKVNYHFTAQGKEMKEEDDLEENAIIPDMIEAHVRKNWDTLMSGEDVKVRLMILERQETIGFKFFLDKERDVSGKKVVDLIMKPSSIFIAMIAPNFYLSFEKEAPHRILEIKGSMHVREPEVPNPKNRKDYSAIRGRVEFIYK